MRQTCPRCRRVPTLCLCEVARPVECDVRFVILIHPKEARRSVGTARIVQLCLPRTLVIEGTGRELEVDSRLQAIVSDPSLDPWLLFPGPDATPVEMIPPVPAKRPIILLVDGTWHQAKKMIRECPRLQRLPCASIHSLRKSVYGFRRQPAPHCLSTVEAAHEVISRLEPSRDADVMLRVFSRLVQSQLGFPARRLEA